MPVFTRRIQSLINDEALVDALAAEIAGSASTTGEPQIYVDELSAARVTHVLVIWERWRDIPPSRRSAIIYDAYEKVDPKLMLRLKFASGFTYDEAVSGGYLPYKVESMLRPSDAVDGVALQREYLTLGARQTPTGLELRYPYEFLAEDAIQQLEQKFGKGNFAIAREVGTVGHWITQ